jgi:hypothetical protein
MLISCRLKYIMGVKRGVEFKKSRFMFRSRSVVCVRRRIV